MDQQQLRTFVAVVRAGSFSRAAAGLGYTQSAVSQQIAALEADLGVPLLRRRPVQPTPAGARLLEHADALLLRFATARADVARLRDGPGGRVLLGASALALGADVVPRIAAASGPRPELTVRVLGRDDVLRSVADGTVDLGLLDGAAAPTDPLRLPEAGLLTSLAVAERPLVVLLPAGHPLAGRRGLDLADLADARWIDAPDAAVPLAQLGAATGTEGFRPGLRYEGTDLPGLIAFAAAGYGLVLLPEPAVAGATGVVGVRLRAPRLVHRIELLHGALPAGPVARLVAALTRPGDPAAAEADSDLVPGRARGTVEARRGVEQLGSSLGS